MERFGSERTLFRLKGKATRSITLGDGEKMEVANTAEQVVNVLDYARKCADPLVIKNLSLLLSIYKSNADNINHYLCKLFQRIAFKLQIPHIFFQVCHRSHTLTDTRIETKRESVCGCLLADSVLYRV
jgi:hypothetical protein